jgi:hypothetical protein
MIVSMIMRVECSAKDPAFLNLAQAYVTKGTVRSRLCFWQQVMRLGAGVCSRGMVYETKFTPNANE